MENLQFPELVQQWANDILVWVGFGTIVGLLAKAIMPGRDPGGAIATLAMGVGGTFDFIAGKRKRAPRWMQSIGLEWLWRLVREPSRFLRIWRAVVVFPYYVVRYRK